MKHHTTKNVVILLIAALVISCNGKNGGKETDNKLGAVPNTYSNKSVYEIAVGDTLIIYRQRGAATRFFVEEGLDQLRHLELLEDRVVVPAKSKHCEGCSRTHALVFIARSAGTDTIFNRIKDGLHEKEDTVEVAHVIYIRKRLDDRNQKR